MLRLGFNEPGDDTPDDHPLFGDAAQKQLAAIEGSEIWGYLKQGLIATREALFVSKPTSTEDLWRTWGALDALTALLHTGPASVLQYSLLARKVEEPDNQEGYVAKAAMFEG